MVDASGVNRHFHLIWRCLVLVVPINDHMVSGTPGTSRKERRMDICKKADFMTLATIAQDGTLVGAVAFIHRELEIPRYLIKSGQNITYKMHWLWEWTLKRDCRCNSCLQPNLIPIREGGGKWVSCFLPMQDITLRRFTDPHTSLGVPGPTSLLAPSFTRCNCFLFFLINAALVITTVAVMFHQMHLKHPT